MRSQVIALIAAAIEPQEFSTLVSRNAVRSLAYLLDTPVPIRSAPELFCLDLYKDYDLNSLEVLASPVRITATESTEPLGTWKLKRTRNSTPGQTNHAPGWEKVRCSVKRFRFWLLSLVQLAGHHFRIKGA
jgi:hypothetical protein